MTTAVLRLDRAWQGPASRQRPLRPLAEHIGRRLLWVVILVWAAGFGIGFIRSLSILTMIGFGCAIAGLKRPMIGLFGMSMLCTTDAMVRHFLLTSGGLLRWNSYNYLLLLSMLLSVRFLVQIKDPYSSFMKGFVVLLLAQLAVTADLSLGIEHMVSIVSSFGLLVYFAKAKPTDKTWYWMAVVNGMIGTLGCLVFYLQRSSLPVINLNVLGFLPITAIFAICLGFRAAAAERRGQLFLALMAMVNLFWVFLTGSRGNLFVAAICITFLVMTTKSASQRFVTVGLGLIMAIAASALFTDLQDYALHRIDKMMDSEAATENRTSGRSDLALGGWHLFLNHPLGVGTGGFDSAWASLGTVKGISGFKYGVRAQAHSGWIKVLAENGLPGILLMAGFVFSFAFSGIRSADRDVRYIGVLVSVVLVVAFLSTEFQGKHLWFLAAGATTLLHSQAMAIAVQGGQARALRAGPQQSAAAAIESPG